MSASAPMRRAAARKPDAAERGAPAYARFRRRFRELQPEALRRVIAANPAAVRVKKPERVQKNLDRIFRAALALSARKGFQAMSMRELAAEAGLSLGAIYAYVPGKEELLAMLQDQGRTLTAQLIEESVAAERTAAGRLSAAVMTHLYLSEAMQPWFYFSFMEAKNLSRPEMEKAVASERYTEKIFSEILAAGRRAGEFSAGDPVVTAGIVKAMLQDWYLKRGKHAERGLSVERYGRAVLDILFAYLSAAPDRRAGRGGRKR